MKIEEANKIIAEYIKNDLIDIKMDIKIIINNKKI